MAKFGLLGLGYISNRHIDAIHALHHELALAYDPTKTLPDCTNSTDELDFFHSLQKKQIDWVSICSPSALHKSQIEQSLRNNTQVIVEKPTCLSLAELQSIQATEQETHNSVYTIFQLRYHPEILQLKQQMEQSKAKNHQVVIEYRGPRNVEYFNSWKGDVHQSGGIVSAVGIHYFDILTMLFGSLTSIKNNQTQLKYSTGDLELEHAKIHWNFEFVDQNSSAQTVNRSFLIDGVAINLSTYNEDLHQQAYKEIFEGRGITTNQVRPTIEVVDAILSNK